jgi:hypothetical protein
MSYEKPSVILSRCMAPLIFDIDGLWNGCAIDTVYFAKLKNRWFRFRNAFQGEWGELENQYQSTLVIRFPWRRFRLRIGLPDVTVGNCPAWNEPVSDIGVSEELFAQIHHKELP